MPTCENKLETTVLKPFELKGIPSGKIEAAVLAEILRQVIADRKAKGTDCNGDCYYKGEACTASIPALVYGEKVEKKLWTKVYLNKKGKLRFKVKLEAKDAAAISIGSECECLPKDDGEDGGEF